MEKVIDESEANQLSLEEYAEKLKVTTREIIKEKKPMQSMKVFEGKWREY